MRCGASAADIAQRRATDGLREVVATEVARAREMFTDTRVLDEALHPSVRPGVRLARTVYESILDRVEALDHDVLTAPIRVAPWRVGKAALSAFRPARRVCAGPR